MRQANWCTGILDGRKKKRSVLYTEMAGEDETVMDWHEEPPHSCPQTALKHRESIPADG